MYIVFLLLWIINRNDNLHASTKGLRTIPELLSADDLASSSLTINSS
jgi:hypothetical protein